MRHADTRDGDEQHHSADGDRVSPAATASMWRRRPRVRMRARRAGGISMTSSESSSTTSSCSNSSCSTALMVASSSLSSSGNGIRIIVPQEGHLARLPAKRTPTEIPLPHFPQTTRTRRAMDFLATSAKPASPPSSSGADGFAEDGRKDSPSSVPPSLGAVGASPPSAARKSGTLMRWPQCGQV